MLVFGSAPAPWMISPHIFRLVVEPSLDTDVSISASLGLLFTNAVQVVCSYAKVIDPVEIRLAQSSHVLS